MINSWLGWSERSKAHAYCVNRVKSHLKRTCTMADKEMGLVPSRITDAWGYNKEKKTWFLCEIKVNVDDLHKAVTQIHDTCYRFKPKNRDDKVIPVIAIPNKLYIEMQRHDLSRWTSFRSLCQQMNIALWIVEQSNIRQIQGPKPTMPKPKATTKPKTTVRARATAKPKKIRRK